MESSNALSHEVDQFLCAVLRGELLAWPSSGTGEFALSFFQRSRHHGVQALVFDRARSSPEWGGWPESIREQLADALRAGVAFELLRDHEIAKFLGTLAQRGIAFLLTKGEALARTNYSSSAMRTRCDTDLFIDIREIEPVRGALLESGYEVVAPIYKSHQFMGVARQKNDAAVIFDVHWRILNAPQFARVISFGEALEHSVPVPGMSACRTLGAVDSLLLACMHRKGSAWHDEGRLIWLYDIHLLVSAMAPEELMLFAGEAVDKNVQDAALDGLQRAKACFHTVVADEILEILKTEAPAGTAHERYRSSNLALLLDDFRSLPEIRAKFGLIRELFFPAPRLLMRKYGRKSRFWLLWLYMQQFLGGVAKRLTLR